MRWNAYLRCMGMRDERKQSAACSSSSAAHRGDSCVDCATRACATSRVAASRFLGGACTRRSIWSSTARVAWRAARSPGCLVSFNQVAAAVSAAASISFHAPSVA